jgi:hypothetical protein
MACRDGDVEVVKLLSPGQWQDSGADQDKPRSSDGATPLNVAKQEGHEAVVQVFEAWASLTELRPTPSHHRVWATVL